MFSFSCTKYRLVTRDHLGLWPGAGTGHYFSWKILGIARGSTFGVKTEVRVLEL